MEVHKPEDVPFKNYFSPAQRDFLFESLLYIILPIQGAIDAYYQKLFQKAEEKQQKQRTKALMEN